MILVPNFVSPAAEAAAGVDVVFVLQGGEELFENAFALEGRGGIPVVEAAVVGTDDLIVGLEHGRVEEAGDAIFEDAGLVYGFEAGFRNFEHDGPIGSLFRFGGGGLGAVGELLGGEFDGGLGLVVGGVVGEDGGAVEGAVVFREVKPAFVADAFGAGAADADADDVGGGVEKVFGEGDEVGLVHFLDEGIDAHGVDEFLIADCFAVFEGDDFIVSVDCLDGAVGAELGPLFGDGVGYGNPDSTGAAVGREAKCRVWAPIAGRLLKDHILGDGLEIWRCYPLAEPLALHLWTNELLIRKEQTEIIPWLWVRPRP